MLADISAVPMEIEENLSNAFASSKTTTSPHKPRSSPMIRAKPRSCKLRQQWHCSDLTVVTKQNGSVKLANRLFAHNESCNDSMYSYSLTSTSGNLSKACRITARLLTFSNQVT